MCVIELTVLSLLAFKFSTQLDQIKFRFPMHADAIIKRTKAVQGVQFVDHQRVRYDTYTK